MTEQNVLIQKKQYSKEVGEHIGLELGTKLIKNHHDATGDTSAHFVGKDIVLNLLNQPNCVGINIFKAIDESGKNTYVLVGMDNAGKAIIEYPVITPDGELSKQEGIVADRMKIDFWNE